MKKKSCGANSNLVACDGFEPSCNRPVGHDGLHEFSDGFAKLRWGFAPDDAFPFVAALIDAKHEN